MAMALRLRTPDGKAQTISLPADATLRDLHAEAATRSGLPRCEILAGFPPALIDGALDAPASSVVRSGESVLVRPAPASVSSPSTRTALYTHADGQREVVRVITQHAAGEGGGFTIFIPSLGRERNTVPEKLEMNTNI